MISSKKLIKLAKRWQKFVAIRRKRISFPALNEDTDCCSASFAVNKGNFAIYTADQKRFVVPLSYLENEIIRQLLNMSEEEFGLPSNGPITLPCGAAFMEYIISLLRQEAYQENLRMHWSSQLLHLGVHQLHCTKKCGEIWNCQFADINGNSFCK